MMQLLMRESNRGWEHINADPAVYEAVTPDDIMRVAKAYFTSETRAVAIYYRTEGADADNESLLVGLSDEERQQIRQMQAMLSQLDGAELDDFRARADQMAEQAPSESQDFVQVLQTLIQQRLDEIVGER
tara:strand:- start:267 stop:656 length:390 start_codon:yes stop_codon:yes gene_type:complete